MHFNFRIISHNFIPNNKSSTSLNKINESVIQSNHKISNINLPLTMDLHDWGNIKFTSNYKEANLEIENYDYHFTLYKNYYICEITSKNDVNLLTFKDSLLNKEDLTYFKREIIHKGFTRRLFIYNNYEVIFKAVKHIPKFLTKINKVGFIKNKFITLDIETKVINY